MRRVGYKASIQTLFSPEVYWISLKNGIYCGLTMYSVSLLKDMSLYAYVDASYYCSWVQVSEKYY